MLLVASHLREGQPVSRVRIERRDTVGSRAGENAHSFSFTGEMGASWDQGEGKVTMRADGGG